MSKFKHALYTLAHPFHGFEEIKWQHKGSVVCATLFLLFYYFVSIVEPSFMRRSESCSSGSRDSSPAS